MTRGQGGSLPPSLCDSCIHDSTPVYPGAHHGLLEGRSARCGWNIPNALIKSRMFRVLYSSIQDVAGGEVAERAVRAAIGDRPDEWVCCLVQPPRQALWIIVLDGPAGFTRTWAFDEADQHYFVMRQTIAADLDADYVDTFTMLPALKNSSRDEKSLWPVFPSPQEILENAD
jgi:hypothetical protein